MMGGPRCRRLSAAAAASCLLSVAWLAVAAVRGGSVADEAPAPARLTRAQVAVGTGGAAESEKNDVAATAANVAVEAALADRVREYCANPPVEVAAEGRPPLPGARLVAAQVVFRHGDRSAIHALPRTVPVGNATGVAGRWPCTAPSATEAAWAAAALLPTPSTQECVVHGVGCAVPGAPATGAHRRVREAIRAWQDVRDEGEPCGADGGDLSSVGWQQLSAIGEGLAAAYAPLMAWDNAATTALQVTTTDTGRTALSATAALRGFLHGLGASAEEGGGDAEGDPPRVCDDDGDTLPHALGLQRQCARAAATRHADAALAAHAVPQLSLPLTLHVVNRDRDPLMYGLRPASVCPRAASDALLADEGVHAHARLPLDVAARMAAAAGLSIEAGVGEGLAPDTSGGHLSVVDASNTLPGIEETVDDLYTRACHGHDLPCWRAPPPALSHPADGSSYPQYAPLVCMSPSDALTLLTGADAHYQTRFGSESTRWLMQPYLAGLVTQLRATLHAALPPAVPPPAASSPPPPARVVLRASHDTVISPLLSTLGLTPRPRAWPGYASRVSFQLWAVPGVPTSDATAYVTVTYNGADITAATGCTRFAADGGVCTLAAFDAFVTSLLPAGHSFTDVCRM